MKGLLTMPPKDLYDRMCDFFGIQTGPVPDPENLKIALKQIVSERDLELYFLMPLFNEITLEKLDSRARRKGFSQVEFEKSLQRLLQESIIEKLTVEGQVNLRRVFSVFVAENQVRKKQGTALGKRFAKYWMDVSQISADHLPSKTPYARVLVVEEEIPDRGTTSNVAINQPIKNGQEAVPYDFITEMMANADRIAVAECYCRLSMEMTGQPCEHEKETCFLFNHAAESLVEIGVARPVDLEEAVQIIQRCEEHGLVHNINNCQEEITFLCNCCPCCCPILRSLEKGLTNVSAPSRFVAARIEENCVDCGACVDVCYVGALQFDGRLTFDADRCIGCGLCVSHCPDAALVMVTRQTIPAMKSTSEALNKQIQREAMFGKVKQWLFGR
jgi:ferredoxin